MGQASAWGMARRRPLEYRQKVDVATRCSDAFSHTSPDLPRYEVNVQIYSFEWIGDTGDIIADLLTFS